MPFRSEPAAATPAAPIVCQKLAWNMSAGPAAMPTPDAATTNVEMVRSARSRA
ncbi:hypothetical protein [Streptomyces sp. NPDC046978]|uniref:hypothetical protein n=1 Tax=unclassified Streptomyces TaxID=2593676 RepID=UPI0033C1A80C